MLVSLLGGLGDKQRTRDVQDNNVKFVFILSESLCVGVSASYALVYKNSLFLLGKMQSRKHELEGSKIFIMEITTGY